MPEDRRITPTSVDRAVARADRALQSVARVFEDIALDPLRPRDWHLASDVERARDFLHGVRNFVATLKAPPAAVIIAGAVQSLSRVRLDLRDPLVDLSTRHARADTAIAEIVDEIRAAQVAPGAPSWGDGELADERAELVEFVARFDRDTRNPREVTANETLARILLRVVDYIREGGSR